MITLLYVCIFFFIVAGLCFVIAVLAKNKGKEYENQITELNGTIDNLKSELAKAKSEPEALTLDGIKSVLEEMGYETNVNNEEHSIVFKRNGAPYKLFANNLPTIYVTLTFNIDEKNDIEAMKQASMKVMQGLLYPVMEFYEDKAFRFCVYQIEFSREHLRKSLPYVLYVIDRTMGFFDFAYKDLIRQKNSDGNAPEKPQITIQHNPGISS